MDESENEENVSSNDTGDNNDKDLVDVNKILQLLGQFINNSSYESNEQTDQSSSVFDELLNKLKQLHDNKDNHENFIRQIVPLCNELINTIKKADFTDPGEVQTFHETIVQMATIFDILITIKDQKFLIRGLFFDTLDLLYKKEIYSCFNDKRKTTATTIRAYKCVIIILICFLTVIINIVSFVKVDADTQKYANLFTSMYQKVIHDIQLIDQKKEIAEIDKNITTYIFSFFWNLADKTVMVPLFLNIGLTKAILHCFKAKNLSTETFRQLINVIHNISRHDNGADELNKLNSLPMLKDMQSKYGSLWVEQENLLISMTIVLLSTPQQIREDNKRVHKILDLLLQTVVDATKQDNFRSTEGFHVSEPLAVFTKLFTDDRSLKYVLDEAKSDPQLNASEKIKLFIDLFMKFRHALDEKNEIEQFTCIALLNILWSISFHDEYTQTLQNNQTFLKTVEDISKNYSEDATDHYAPRSMESFNKAANSILDNLDETLDNKQPDIIDRSVPAKIENKKPMIMISYSHDDKNFCYEILAELGKKIDLFRIWIDRDYLKSNEDLWEKIARAIKESKIVLLILSQKYYASKSCRNEATYAIKRNKSIIPVYIGEPGDCDWL
ncbi:unnamed protein product, partial [Rotaria sordida]